MTKKRRNGPGRRYYRRGPAARKLQEFLEENDIIDRVAAEHMGVTRPAVISWTTARSFPGEKNRKAIEKFTKGAVPASLWDVRP